MRQAAICLATFCLFGLIGSTSSAADKAATSEMPAALKTLDVSDSQILSQEQAETVRGEGYSRFWVGGGVYVHNAVAHGVVYTESYQPVVVNIVLTPYVFGYRISH